VLSAQLAIDELVEEETRRVRIAEAPVVEGAVVAASSQHRLQPDEVDQAARDAATMTKVKDSGGSR
jgi:dihydroxyacetone kinase DhaKLM complex PTS-EIIA-like component DhaM